MDRTEIEGVLDEGREVLLSLTMALSTGVADRMTLFSQARRHADALACLNEEIVDFEDDRIEYLLDRYAAFMAVLVN